MNSTLFILAEEGGKSGSPFGGILPMMLIMFGLMYFLIIRPQSQQRKKMAAMLAAVKSGDKVVTAGGIHGMVTSVKEATVILKIADGTKVEFEKSSIGQVIPKEKKGGSSSQEEVEDAEEKAN